MVALSVTDELTFSWTAKFTNAKPFPWNDIQMDEMHLTSFAAINLAAVKGDGNLAIQCGLRLVLLIEEGFAKAW